MDNFLNKDFSLISYADDVMIMARATPNNAKIIIEMLDNFKTWNGQHINVSKSHIMYCPSL